MLARKPSTPGKQCNDTLKFDCVHWCACNILYIAKKDITCDTTTHPFFSLFIFLVIHMIPIHLPYTL